MTYIQERGSTHVYHVNRMSKEEMDHMIGLCVHEQPAYCVAACPFKAAAHTERACATLGEQVLFICWVNTIWESNQRKRVIKSLLSVRYWEV